MFSKILISILALLGESGLRVFHYLDERLPLAKNPVVVSQEDSHINPLGVWMVNEQQKESAYAYSGVDSSGSPFQYSGVSLPRHKIASVTRKIRSFRSTHHPDV